MEVIVEIMRAMANAAHAYSDSTRGARVIHSVDFYESERSIKVLLANGDIVFFEPRIL